MGVPGEGEKEMYWGDGMRKGGACHDGDVWHITHSYKVALLKKGRRYQKSIVSILHEDGDVTKDINHTRLLNEGWEVVGIFSKRDVLNPESMVDGLRWGLQFGHWHDYVRACGESYTPRRANYIFRRLQSIAPNLWEIDYLLSEIADAVGRRKIKAQDALRLTTADLKALWEIGRKSAVKYAELAAELEASVQEVIDAGF